jgi:hypothetical protein
MSESGDLLERYIASFPRLDRMVAQQDSALSELGTGPADEFGFQPWRPLPFKTEASALEPLYAELPAPFPSLYEKLVLSYRWAEVELGLYALVANPPGADLGALLTKMVRDPNLWEMLIPAGFIQFAKGPGLDYDPVCFDTRSRNKSGDYRIVKIDHEGILSNYRVKIVDELAPSFEQLVLDTVERAKSIQAV